jgi:hypothetical protein
VAGQNALRLLDELIHIRSRALGLRRQGLYRQRLHVQSLRVRLRKTAVEPVGAEHQQETVLPNRLDEELDAGQLGLPQQIAELRAGVGADPTGTTVRHAARIVHRAEVAARRHVLGLKVEVIPGLHVRPPIGRS